MWPDKLYSQYLGGFDFQSRVLTTKELHDPNISEACARIMAQFHQLQMPLVKEPRWLFDIMTRSLIYSILDNRVLQQFPFAISISRIDLPGIPKFPSHLIPSSLINFDHTYLMLSFTNFQSYECDKRFTAILYVVWYLFHTFSLFL